MANPSNPPVTNQELLCISCRQWPVSPPEDTCSYCSMIGPHIPEQARAESSQCAEHKPTAIETQDTDKTSRPQATNHDSEKPHIAASPEKPQIRTAPESRPKLSGNDMWNIPLEWHAPNQTGDVLELPGRLPYRYK